MLKTRVITAVVLLAVLLPVLFYDYFPGFALLTTAFFAAAMWESLRLFKSRHALPWSLLCTIVFVRAVFFSSVLASGTTAFLLCTALWLVRFVPALGAGLPAIEGIGNRLLGIVYGFAIAGCFGAIVLLFQHSPVYLLSVMALVWIADIGAYFSGRAFGRHKLAPSISPGKSWEGAAGGASAVLLAGGLCMLFAASWPLLQDTFAVRLQQKFGVPGACAVLLLAAGASVVGDLFESMLKRRAGVKDSSNLLPGHGGVLDRIDALIPVLPLAALISIWANAL